MKEVNEKRKIKRILFNLLILFFLNVIAFSKCDISISKLSKDILKDFNNYKVANFINNTHFSCDNGENILELEKFNDDFCDCLDGSDENSNYLLSSLLNKPYFSLIIFIYLLLQ